MATKKTAKPRTKVCEICGLIVNLRGYNGHVRFAHGGLPTELQPTDSTALKSVLERVEEQLANLANSIQSLPQPAPTSSGELKLVCPKCGSPLVIDWTPPGIMRFRCIPCWEAG
jgi:hypothetical protein